MGQNLNIKIHKNQNLKFTKFPNFQILHLNFILDIVNVHLNLSIFVELIEMVSLDQLQAEFNSDCEILALITKIKSAQQELLKASAE